MTFEEWFNELEGFTLRSERFHSMLFYDRVTKLHVEMYVNWLKAAFEAGKENATD